MNSRVFHTGIILLMLFSVAGHAFLKTGIWLTFEMQRDRIALEECVERSNPSNCCKGSCVLQSQLKETDSASPEQAPDWNQIKEIVLYVEPADITPRVPENSKLTRGSLYREITSLFIASRPLKPPAA